MGPGQKCLYLITQYSVLFSEHKRRWLYQSDNSSATCVAISGLRWFAQMLAPITCTIFRLCDCGQNSASCVSDKFSISIVHSCRVIAVRPVTTLKRGSRMMFNKNVWWKSHWGNCCSDCKACIPGSEWLPPMELLTAFATACWWNTPVVLWIWQH